MSSSSSARAPSKGFRRPKISASYRQTEFHDGNAVRIQESRRRSMATGVSSLSALFQRDNHEHQPVSIQATCCRSSAGVHHQVSRPSLRKQGDLDVHIIQATSLAHVREQGSTKAAIIPQDPAPKHATTKERNVSSKASLPTPPPTPRLGRLPTPELLDLKDVPFCDCCSDKQVAMYCCSCGKELERSQY